MDFKSAKEIVLALKEIAKNIQSDKSSNNNSDNNENESNNVYDGILKVGRRNYEIMLSFGIKDNDNPAKLGDLFTDNFINDLNNEFITYLSDNEEEYYVSTVSKLNNEIIQTRANPNFEQYGSASFYYNEGIIEIYIIPDKGTYRIAFSGELLTKDTPLEKVSA